MWVSATWHYNHLFSLKGFFLALFSSMLVFFFFFLSSPGVHNYSSMGCTSQCEHPACSFGTAACSPSRNQTSRLTPQPLPLCLTYPSIGQIPIQPWPGGWVWLWGVKVQWLSSHSHLSGKSRQLDTSHLHLRFWSTIWWTIMAGIQQFPDCARSFVTEDKAIHLK